jgi:hypothetical protein
MMTMVGSPIEQGQVKKRLGIDFGMNSTVIAEFTSEGGAMSTLEFPGWSRRFPLEEENTTPTPVRSSLVSR